MPDLSPELPIPLIYKIMPRHAWQRAERLAASPARRSILPTATFISPPPRSSRRRREAFAGQDDLLLIAVDAAALGPALRWEPSRGGQLVPAPLRARRSKTARWVTPLPLDLDGTHAIPADLA